MADRSHRCRAKRARTRGKKKINEQRDLASLYMYSVLCIHGVVPEELRLSETDDRGSAKTKLDIFLADSPASLLCETKSRPRPMAYWQGTESMLSENGATNVNYDIVEMSQGSFLALSQNWFQHSLNQQTIIGATGGEPQSSSTV